MKYLLYFLVILTTVSAAQQMQTNMQSNNGDNPEFISVAVISPNGGEQWAVGSNQTITWSFSGISHVNLFYTKDDGITVIPITGGFISATPISYSWTIPNDVSSTCKIYIQGSTDGVSAVISDFSDAHFEIFAPSSVTVTSPSTAGISWEAGTTKAITWTSNGVTNVKIEYSTDSGSNYTTIVNSLDASLGTFNWTVPNAPSANCLIQITDASAPAVTDQSDNEFEIFAPSLDLTYPDGGQTYVSGTTETITWTAAGIDNVKIEYSIDDGSTWTLVDPSVAGSLGSYDWTVPNVSSVQCRIRLSDELLPAITDVSTGTFTITKPSVTLNYTAGWNVLSVPFSLDDPVAANVFPTKTSEVFAHSSGYYVIYNVQPGQGFWVQFAGSGSSTVDGSGSSSSIVNVFSGWNIISVPDYDVPVGAIVQSTPGMVVSGYYEYSGSYSAASILTTGKGYWVKCSQSGTLTLPYVPPKVEPLFTPEENWITVTVSDAAGNSQRLYIADASGMFELPPLPPNEIFDARFGDDSYISNESSARQLRFQSEDYPLTISVTNGNLKLTDGASGTMINRQLLDGESMTISNKNIGNLNINTIEIPADYVLHQNYPNPFNPATTIKFGLPQAGKVDITIYNQLGQKVETLISEELEAGYHELQWNASEFSSGVYFYTINSGNFKAVKKMLLLK